MGFQNLGGKPVMNQFSCTSERTLHYSLTTIQTSQFSSLHVNMVVSLGPAALLDPKTDFEELQSIPLDPASHPAWPTSEKSPLGTSAANKQTGGSSAVASGLLASTSAATGSIEKLCLLKHLPSQRADSPPPPQSTREGVCHKDRCARVQWSVPATRYCYTLKSSSPRWERDVTVATERRGSVM